MADEHISAPINADLRSPSSRSKQGHNDITPAIDRYNEARLIIWTPPFIALFALTCIVGLSMTTILIQGWLNAHYSDQAVLLSYTPLLFCLWLVTLIKARSGWVRAGAFSGCLWSFFAAGTFWLAMAGVHLQTTTTISLNIAANTALLGAFICLSLARTSFGIWDTWFFRLLPLLILILLGASYLHSLKDVDALKRLASDSAPLLLYICCAVWWLRPSCWHSQPGPTFLFGLAPLALLLFVLPDIAGNEQVFFFQQIFLLCILLGAMRILQGELQYARAL